MDDCAVARAGAILKGWKLPGCISYGWVLPVHPYGLETADRWRSVGYRIWTNREHYRMCFEYQAILKLSTSELNLGICWLMNLDKQGIPPYVFWIPNNPKVEYLWNRNGHLYFISTGRRKAKSLQSAVDRRSEVYFTTTSSQVCLSTTSSQVFLLQPRLVGLVYL